MASLAETIRAVTTGKPLKEAAAPFTQSNQPAGAGASADPTGGAQPPTNQTPAGGPAEQPDLAGQQVMQAELILIADRAQKIAALVGQGGVADPMLQTQITGIASDISQLYADLMMAAQPDPNADPNAAAGGQSPAAGGSQVNTNPKVAEDVVTVEDVDTIASLLEISTDLARRYVNRSFTDLGDPEISDRRAMNRKAGIKLAVDKAGGADKMWKNKSALGKKYGIPTDEVRVKTTEETSDDPADIEAREQNSTTRGRVKKTKDGYFATNMSGSTKQFDNKDEADKHSMSEEAEELQELFGIKSSSAVNAAYDSLKKKPSKPAPDLKLPGIRVPSDKIKEAVAIAPQNDDDEPNEHIIMQLHKSVTLGGKKIVTFASGQKVKVDPKDAHKALQKFNAMKPMEKAKAQEFLKASHNNLRKFVSEDFQIDIDEEEEELQERVIKAEPHFIDRLEGSMKTSNGQEIEFENGQRVTIPPNVAKKIVEKFRSSSAYDKQQLNKYVRASYANLIRAAR